LRGAEKEGREGREGLSERSSPDQGEGWGEGRGRGGELDTLSPSNLPLDNEACETEKKKKKKNIEASPALGRKRKGEL